MDSTNKLLLHDMSLIGTLIIEDQDGVLVRTSDGGCWDSSFQVFGDSTIGVDNDQNPCVLKIMCPAQGEIFIDGKQYPCFDIEIRFCGPWEYNTCLNWFEVMGQKASEIKKRSFRRD